MKYPNSKQSRFLDSIPQQSLDSDANDLSSRCKFNFSYFDDQQVGQSFSDWTHPQLTSLLEKLKEYSKQPLLYWTKQSVGMSGAVLSIYQSFPSKSDFVHPKHVPHQAHWGRFRLEQAVRLVGFVLPGSYHDREHPFTKRRFDCNTFYVVFLDLNHRFYKSREGS